METAFINELVESLNAALRNELSAREVMLKADTHADHVKATVLYEAYESKAIKGANKEARDRAEAVFLATSVVYQTALNTARDAQHAHALAKIEVETTRTEISLVKALGAG